MLISVKNITNNAVAISQKNPKKAKEPKKFDPILKPNFVLQTK